MNSKCAFRYCSSSYVRWFYSFFQKNNKTVAGGAMPITKIKKPSLNAIIKGNLFLIFLNQKFFIMRKWNYFLKTSLATALMLFATASFAQDIVQHRHITPGQLTPVKKEVTKTKQLFEKSKDGEVAKVKETTNVAAQKQMVKTYQKRAIGNVAAKTVQPAHTAAEKQALKEAEIAAVAAKKAGPITKEAVEYMRSLGHPEFMDYHGEDRKAKIAEWGEAHKDQLDDIQEQFILLNAK